MISDDGFVDESAEYKVVSMMQHVYMARSVNDELVNFRGTIIAVHRKEEE